MKGCVKHMHELEERIGKIAPEADTKSTDEDTARYHAILMRLLEDAKREFDQWPEWKKQYSITTRA
jgi:hypothetical protein